MCHEKISCPKCDWEPRPESLWMCTCGHQWNTFETAACCPACNQQWEETCCLNCHEWSMHVDWYRDIDDWLTEILEEEQLSMPVFADERRWASLVGDR